MYSLNELWLQAEEDTYAATLDSRGYSARLLCGIKIIKCNETDKVQVFNTTLNGDYYKEEELYHRC